MIAFLAPSPISLSLSSSLILIDGSDNTMKSLSLSLTHTHTRTHTNFLSLWNLYNQILLLLENIALIECMQSLSLILDQPTINVLSIEPQTLAHTCSKIRA